MKKFVIAALALACVFTLEQRASAQSASFLYSNLPAGPLAPGASFTIGVTLDFTQGGAITNLGGLSYWFYQQNPTSGFPFSITNRDVTGSQFSQLQSPFILYPQIMDPINRNPDGSQDNTDLGALGNPNVTNGTGTYFIANITFSIAGNAAGGTYTISNTTAAAPSVGGRISRINANNMNGTTSPITSSPFNITVIPEPSSLALLAFAAVGVAAFVLRRRLLRA